MTNELLKEAIYAVALKDKLSQYPYGCFTQLYYNYIKNLVLELGKEWPTPFLVNIILHYYAVCLLTNCVFISILLV